MYGRVRPGGARITDDEPVFLRFIAVSVVRIPYHVDDLSSLMLYLSCSGSIWTFYLSFLTRAVKVVDWTI